MISKEDALSRISALVQRFEEQHASYMNSEYNETQTRRDFIDPFFKALGWDIDNSQGHAEAYREVIHEDKVKVSGQTKAPDYSFRLSGGKRLFFVEAKKPSVGIKENIEPAYQVRRYGWSAKLSVSIVTDFEEFAIYDCTKKPNPNDNAAVARVKYFTYKDYVKEFDFIWNTFAKENVLKGSFDNFISGNKDKTGTQTVDKEFLISLDRWRTLLAESISKQNKELNEDELNFAVQQTIDRLIFLRIAEDRKVEIYGSLQSCLNSGDFYRNLFTIFREADIKYNSGLFDFKKDSVCEKINIDNKTIKTIINDLYYPNCPYEFSVLSVEILGSAYEQFLGKTITIGKYHKAEIEYKPEVRKAGGVYYTPQYIVDYIVKNTVGKLLGDTTPNEVSKIKICDPACGSGSFLIGAYQFLLDWHKDYYTKQGKSKVLQPDGNLTTAEKKRILLNNIYGVDLDVNAVEVTKLSLLLKCMEGETEASINQQLKIFKERVLPTLDDNIKCGNSLIDIDFYDSQIDFEPGMEKKVKPFNWESAFPSVFGAGDSGFDVVIGNPPYGAELDKASTTYLQKKFPIGNTDTAALFLILSKQLMKSQGYNGFIIPKSFTYASNWSKTRDILLPDIFGIVDCSKVWKEVKLEMSIYLSQKESNSNVFESFIRNNESITSIGFIEKQLCNEFEFILNGVSEQEIKIGKKIKKQLKSLNDFVVNQRGAIYQKEINDFGEYFVLGGKQIIRYSSDNNVKGKLKKEIIKDNKAYIKVNSILVQRLVAHIMNPIPHLKIIGTLSKEYDKSKYVLVDTINQLTNISNLPSNYLLAIINSHLISWYSYKFIFANAIRTMQFDNPTSSKIPIPEPPTPNTEAEMVRLDLQKATLPEQKEHLKARIAYTDKKIDQLVYQLYGLTEEEIKIVEGG